MKLVPYLHFDGRCAEALRTYEEILGGKLTFSQTWGESPMARNAPPGWKEKIVHATFAIGDQLLNGADMPPGHYQAPSGFSIAIAIERPEDADRIFAALSVGGKVEMPLAETYWARRFGMLTDRFGTPWMVNCSN